MKRVHGLQISRSGESLEVGHVPERKSPALMYYKASDNTVEVLAYFRGTEQANRMVDFMTKFASEVGIKVQ